MAKTFKDEYLTDFPRVEKPHVSTNNGGHWTHEATCLEGDLRLIRPGRYEVISDKYAYRRFDYGWPNSIRNAFVLGDFLLTRDSEEKDSYGH